MPKYRVHVVNRDFASSDDREFPNMEVARTEAIRGALQIGTQEVCEGRAFFAAQITIDNDHAPTERILVAVGASPIQ